jgi:hypothetical protein
MKEILNSTVVHNSLGHGIEIDALDNISFGFKTDGRTMLQRKH